MKPRILVGNDVVDVAWMRDRQRATNRRFVQRVFTARERETIAAADDPDVELWSHWAAKEAAFKVVSKRLGTPPVFAHRAFPVEWTEESLPAVDAHSSSITRVGAVDYVSDTEDPDEAAGPVYVTVERVGDVLHSVGHGGEGTAEPPAGVCGTVALLDAPGRAWNASLEALLPRFSEREADAVYSRESAAVRIGAKAALATALGVRDERVEIVCAPGSPGRRPPRVLVGGESGCADVSLSHHGAWIAWAIWCPLSR